jgi:ethanolamine utilization protein EutQ (cupin superfamily)
MPRQIFTAEDIRRLAGEKSAVLVLGPTDIITHEALDAAISRGVELVRETESGSSLERNAALSSSALPPLKVVRGAGVQLEPFKQGRATPGANVRLQDVVVTRDGSPMGAGYMSSTKANWSGR